MMRAFVASYLMLMREDAAQRDYELRYVFNALRWIVRAGSPWHLLPHDFPPWPTVYQQTRRWLAAGCFEALVQDLRAVLRLAADRTPDPSAVIFDSRTRRLGDNQRDRDDSPVITKLCQRPKMIKGWGAPGWQ